MENKKIIAMLRSADPNKNSSTHERKTALQMAQKEMDKQGLSFASLGFSMEDAERISNQFAVISPQAQPKAQAPINSILRASKSTILRPRRSDPQSKRAQQPLETYADQCERNEAQADDANYDALKNWRISENIKNAEMSKVALKAEIFVIILAVIVFVAIALSVIGALR